MSISSQKPSPQQAGQKRAIPRGSKSATRSRCSRSTMPSTTPISRAAKSISPQALRDMLGMKPDDPAYTTGNIIETIHPDDRPVYREAIVDAFQGQHAPLRGRLPLPRPRRKLALVPPVRRGGPAAGRARLSHRRRDVRRNRNAPARPRARDRQGRGSRRLSARRQHRRAPRRRTKSAMRSRWSRSTTAFTTGIWKRTRSISPPTCASCSASRRPYSRPPTTGASASTRRTIRCSAAG